MKRILFVDDEPRILQGLERMLFPMGDQWDMAFVNSGQAALCELESAPVDVLVTEMRMPGMDGATLLTRVQESHPAVVRLVLSGHTETEAALRAVPVAHQFLMKPCDPEVLENVIDRACDLQELIGDPMLRRLVSKIERLPPAPRMYAALTKALANPDTGAKEVARIVERDMAMCAKLLQLVNSSFFTRGKSITSIQVAVVRLGLQMVKNLVLSFEVFDGVQTPRKIKGFCIDALHRHALLTASIAGRMFRDRRMSEDAFMAGILHNVGQLVLAMELPNELEAALAVAAAGEPQHVAERQLLGVSHAEVGGYLLGLWGLPYPIVEAVAYHHEPDGVARRELDLLSAIHVADLLACEAADPADEERDDTHLLACLETVGAAGALVGWRETARDLADRAEEL